MSAVIPLTAMSRAELQAEALTQALESVDLVALAVTDPRDRIAALGLVRGRLEQHLGQALRERRQALAAPREDTGD